MLSDKKIPKVSVIMSAYNGEMYIREAIDSILAQSYKNYEIIVVDDGSTDSTREILNSYGEAIRYFFQENQGATKAECFGILQAQGEYIASLDQDDAWMPNLLEEQIKILDSNTELAFVCAAAHVINEKGEAIDKYESGIYCESSFEGLLEDNFVLHCTVLLRHEYYDEVGGFDPQITITHDIDLWLRLAKRYKFVYQRKLLAKYRLHNNNSTKNLDSWLENRLKLFKKKDIMEGVGFVKRRKYTAKIYYQFAGFYNLNNEFYKAGLMYLKAVLVHPFIGFYYWPNEVKGVRYAFLYRILKVYFLIFTNWFRAITKAPKLIN